jgi:hypothetical protein
MACSSIGEESAVPSIETTLGFRSPMLAAVMPVALGPTPLRWGSKPNSVQSPPAALAPEAVDPELAAGVEAVTPRPPQATSRIAAPSSDARTLVVVFTARPC